MNTDQTNAAPLIPCPFCGATEHDSLSEIALIPAVRMHKFHGTAFSVRCDECVAQGPIRSTADGAIVWWNARTKTKRSKPAAPKSKLSPEDAKMLHELAAELGALDSMPVWLLREIEGGLEP